MNCFLVDYENESGRLLQGVSLAGLTEEDELIIFYSKHAERVKIPLLKELDKTHAKKEYIKVETGTQNALDFQLSTYLGACVYKNPNVKYYIVSNDTGYDCVCHFWSNMDVYVRRIEDFFNYEK